jgi:hypothetical protein
MKPLESKECRSWLEVKILSITNALRWIGGSLFLALCVVGIVIRFASAGSLSIVWLHVAEALSVGSMMCALAWLLLDTVPAFVILILFKKYMFGQRQHEANHDLLHVEKLILMDKIVLRQAETWLSIKTDRIKNRMTVFFGGPEKLAIFALAGLGWLVWKEFPTHYEKWTLDALQIAMMLLGGAAIGGLFSLADMRNISYQRELLTMALARLDGSAHETEKIVR